MQMVESEVWRQHRSELLREVEKERLARRLRAERRKPATGIRDALLGLVPGRLSGKKEPAGC